MNLAATLAISLLAAVMLASLCFTLRVPGAHEALKRINWFRTFAHWTMFAAHPDPSLRPGAFSIEYRDSPDGAWLTAIDGHHWAPHSFLLSPRRFLAARAHYLGHIFIAIKREGSQSEFHPEIRDRENLIAAYLQRLHPLPAGATRVVRLVKRSGGGEALEGETAWQFTVRSHD